MCTKAAIINDALAMTIDPTRSPVEALPDYGEEPSILCYAQSEEEERTLTSTSCTGSPVTVAMGTLLPEGDAKIVQFATPLLIPQFHRPGSLSLVLKNMTAASSPSTNVAVADHRSGLAAARMRRTS